MTSKPLTRRERKAARRLLLAIQELRRIDPDMQLPMAASLLIVALKDGVSRTEVMNDLKVAGSTATRNLTGLTEQGRLGRPGHGLVEQKVNPNERRWRMHSLSPKGRTVVRRLAKRILPKEDELADDILEQKAHVARARTKTSEMRSEAARGLEKD